MQSLYEVLKQENCTLEDLKANIGKFVFLSDEEVLEIFESKAIDINIEHLTFIAEHCFNRINKLPLDIFIVCISYVVNAEVFKSHYLKRINELNYQDLVKLLYEGIYEPESIKAIINSDNFDKHLNNEIKADREYNLQCVILSYKIYEYDENKCDIDYLEHIGEELVKIVRKEKEYSEGTQIVLRNYLKIVSENIRNLEKDDKVVLHSLDTIRETLKKEILLTSEMIEIYTLYRAKELGLEEYLKEAVTTYEESDGTFAFYFPAGKIIKIYYKHVVDLYHNAYEKMKKDKISQKLMDKNSLNSILNMEFLREISHELSHVITSKRMYLIEQMKKTEDNVFYNQIMHNLILKQNAKVDKIYNNEHGNFIEENIADIFSYIDFAILTNRLFKDCFPKEKLQSTSSIHAENIINFYTVKKDNQIIMISPMEKFAIFYNDAKLSYVPEISLKDTSNNAIISNLLSGNPIPLEVLKNIVKIANKEILTENLYEEILKIIREYNDTLQDEEIVQKKN